MATKTKIEDNNKFILQQFEFHMTMAQVEFDASAKLSKQLVTLDATQEKNATINAEIQSLKNMLDIVSTYSVRILTSSMNIQNSLNAV